MHKNNDSYSPQLDDFDQLKDQICLQDQTWYLGSVREQRHEKILSVYDYLRYTLKEGTRARIPSTTYTSREKRFRILYHITLLAREKKGKFEMRTVQ